MSSCVACKAVVEQMGNPVFDTRFGIAARYQYGRCSQCGLEQIVPAPAIGKLKALYEQYYNFSGHSAQKHYVSLRQRILSSSAYGLWLWLDGDISFLRKKGRGRLLDIGCNEGRGLEHYRQNGFTSEGLELNERAAAIAREKGFTVSTCLVDDFVPTEKYDVIVLSNVLEHSLDPGKMLRDARRLLNPGGQIWISCPNSQSWLRRVFGGYWINWHPPFHIVQFSAGMLKTLLQESGFSNIHVQNKTPALWVAHSLLARLFARFGQPTLQLRSIFWVAPLMLLARFGLFPLLWLGNQLGCGDCLVVTAENAE